MFEHLRYKTGTVVSASTVGDWTIDVLDLNDDRVLGFRESILAALTALYQKIQATQKTADQVKSKCGETSPEFKRAQRNVDRLRREYARLISPY
jgi:hypothetical protein